VRRIGRTRVPVISAVGHEIDFTIIDFAADVRAATPTQAATIAAPSADELRLEVANLLAELRQAAEMKAETYRTGLSNLLSRPVYRRPMDRVANLRQNLDVLSARILRAVRSRLNVISHRLQSAVNRLETLDPTTILARGYSLAFNRETGRLITRVAQGLPGTPVDLRVCDGILKLRTEEGDEAP
jgi:exodeoxyribonuclease VII large subunit